MRPDALARLDEAQRRKCFEKLIQELRAAGALALRVAECALDLGRRPLYMGRGLRLNILRRRLQE